MVLKLLHVDRPKISVLTCMACNHFITISQKTNNYVTLWRRNIWLMNVHKHAWHQILYVSFTNVRILYWFWKMYQTCATYYIPTNVTLSLRIPESKWTKCYWQTAITIPVQKLPVKHFFCDTSGNSTTNLCIYAPTVNNTSVQYSSALYTLHIRCYIT